MYDDTTRRTDILAAMLRRADARRRTRRVTRATVTAAGALAVVGVAWLAVGPPAQSPRTAPQIATTGEHPEPKQAQKIANAGTPTVIERAISDDELLELLKEAGAQAGLGVIDGKAALVYWHAEPEVEPKAPGPTGARTEDVFLASS